MNEVGMNQTAGVKPASVASSKREGSDSTQEVPSGKQLPPVATEVPVNKEEKFELSREDISRAVAKMNEFVQNEQRDLSFSVDEGSGRTVVRVTHRETGELIRQIPNEVFLRLAENMQINEPVRLINVYG